jgi:transglutaminase-like putative cysteine protease
VSARTIRLSAFAALGCYGALRWSTLVTPAPTARMLGLVALATAAAGLLGGHGRDARMRIAVALIGSVLALVLSLALVGVPLRLLVHLHLHAVASGIGQGLLALPRVTVPYDGVDDWVRIVVLLGGAVLLLDGALVLALAPPSLGDAVRAGAAVPLIALAVVPSTLVRPQLPFVHGLLLLALTAALVWGERVPARALGASLALVGAPALVLAPALDPHRPWIDYQALAGGLAPTSGERFDWSQRYGPLDWPQTGREVLDVKASRGDYWKTENLDTFDGVRWVSGALQAPGLLPTPDPQAAARWTQTITVTIRGMRTAEVVAAGEAARPQHVPAAVLPGDSAGTWVTGVDLGPGDAYTVTTYSPRPSLTAMGATSAAPVGTGSAGTGSAVAGAGAAAGSYTYALLGPYRSILVPAQAPGLPATAEPEIEFPPFGLRAAPRVAGGVQAGTATALIAASPYARAYALAQRLASPATTQIAFVRRVLRYLRDGFTYSESPTASAWPLERFLFADRRGYCQQFAGAMALLLRMGGVPARVAVGFTPGAYDAAARQWVVTDLDAHAWVEVWFPRYGWVRFEPTPSGAPALSGRSSPFAGKVPAAAAAAARRDRGQRDTGAVPRARPAGARGGSGISALSLIIALAVLGVALTAAALARNRANAADPDRLIDELSRALVRTGRRADGGLTLAQLEHRFRTNPSAAAYVRALRLARYAGATAQPGRAERRALRARLSEGLGASGRARALWALPPWPR